MTVFAVVSPFDRLRRTYEADARCTSCGSEDASEWTVRASGRSVRYERECRSCGARERREIRLPA
ncbi:hypothetical protein Halru_0704 [Halovivax ruber XH-70]|uniref:Uncharacterized protein n=1 Tax=Halovivax ruber (strain DSM 18193 / JCM 13892 / XH-70) TaxID=797302 RepID=L0IAT7_HALRX|nr:HVO_0649 family zinc finger protein [Halovivax ruber]AGB15331.1 hypothetical protein Halru_0704 [Halovivax ruber XH-70]